VTHYRNKYFYPTGFKNYQYELKPGAEKTIYDRVAPLVMRIDAATHLDLPDLVFNRIDVELPAAAKKVYNDLKKVLVAEIEGATHIVPTLAAAYGVCCQVANGAIYDQEADGLVLRTLDTYTDVHDEKIKALQVQARPRQAPQGSRQGRPVHWRRRDRQALNVHCGRLEQRADPCAAREPSVYGARIEYAGRR
jgi:hypothetical protein